MQAIRQLGQWLLVLAVGVLIGWASRGATHHNRGGYPERIRITCPAQNESPNLSGKALTRHELLVTSANEDGELVNVAPFDPTVPGGPMWKIELFGGHSRQMILLAEPDPAQRASRE